MNALKSNTFLLTILVVLLLIAPFSLPVYANSVLDCLENEADCEEEQTNVNESADETDDVNVAGGKTFQSTSLVFSILKMIIALLFVLSLIYGIVLILRKRNRLLEQNDIIENFGGITVGPNKSIQLIRIGSHVYAVGVGDHVDLMLEITEPEVIEALLEKKHKEKQPALFGQLFQRERKSKKDQDEFFNQLKQELNKLQSNRSKLLYSDEKKDDEHERIY